MRKKENQTERRVKNKNNNNSKKKKKTNFSFWELEADPPGLDHQNEPGCS